MYLCYFFRVFHFFSIKSWVNSCHLFISPLTDNIQFLFTKIIRSFIFLLLLIRLPLLVLQVSPTYSQEVSGNHAIAPHRYKFHGIRNGIDPDIWDPYNDKFIPVSAKHYLLVSWILYLPHHPLLCNVILKSWIIAQYSSVTLYEVKETLKALL